MGKNMTRFAIFIKKREKSPGSIVFKRKIAASVLFKVFINANATPLTPSSA